MRLAMTIDLDRCVGCQACVTACKEQWDSGPGAQRCWVHEYEHGKRGADLGVTFFPGLCMQCAEHPCTEDCPTGATFRDEKTGVILVDKDVCIGCGNCISTCPYGARTHDASQGIIEKCNLCQPLIERGETPACVATCLADCRHVGDLDDPDGALAQRVARTEARPLTTPDVDVGPATTYAGAAHRAQIIAHGTAVVPPETSWLTKVWTGVTRPVAVFGVPAIGAGAVLGGLVVNVIGRRISVAEAGRGDGAAPARTRPTAGAPGGATPARVDQDGELSRSLEATGAGRGDGAAPARTRPTAGAPGGATPARVDQDGELSRSQATPSPRPADGTTLPRHRAGMRFLHWFNLLSWLLLLLTGTALMSATSFALFGTAFPRWFADLLGGADVLLALHVVWGLIWAAVIVPLFLLYKDGGVEALREIMLTRDDILWMMRKPFALLGLSKQPLPPQDKYNAGQKLFAVSALLGTSLIIGTGLIMTFHLGPPWLVAAAVLGHKLAVTLALVGLSVHITMAAIIRDERPALKSMVTGRVDRTHAEHHSAKWVAELDASTEDDE